MHKPSATAPLRSGRSPVGIVVLIAVAAIVGLFVVPGSRSTIMGFLGSDDGKVNSKFILHKAELGPFRITITENGTVDSLRNSSLKNSVEGSTTIITLVPEGSRVNGPAVADFDGVVEFVGGDSESEKEILLRSEDGEEKRYTVTMGEFTQILVQDRQQVKRFDYLAGDVVCELDSSSLTDLERQQQIAVTTARADLEKADKSVQIQESTNDSLLAQARLAEKLAGLDYTKYVAENGEYRQAVSTIAGDIKQLEEELAMAREELEQVRDQARRGYKNVNEVESKRIALTQKQILLDVKEGELHVLEEFTRERTEAELEQMKEETKNDTLRVKLEGEAAMAQMRADFTAKKLTLEVEEEKLDRLIRQIKASKLVAPQPGEVVYASEESRRSEPTVIEEGATVRERQTIINLPDLDNMKIDARIHESRISRVAVGQPVEIQIDALPTIPFHGHLKSVSSVPAPGSWPNTDLKEYQAEVEITDATDLVRQLKPGMTAEVRIIVDDREEDVLQVPVQSVLALSDKFFAYVISGNKPERREIVVGDANDEYMEIVDGIAEGEMVIMNPRTHFSREINDLTQKLSTELEANRPRVRVPNVVPPERSAEGGPGGGGPRGEGGGPRGEGGGGGGGFDPAAAFERMDTNKDGSITKDESDMRGNFDTVDADSDGQITMQELKTSFESRSR